MKFKRFSSFVLSIICLAMLSLPGFAADARASNQIMSYSMSTTPGNGTIDVEFGITGKGTMSKLGCEYIYVYEKVGTSWSYVTMRDEDDTGMSKKNSFIHNNMISIPCEDDTEYKVVVTVFAEDAEGRDSRTQPFYL